MRQIPACPPIHSLINGWPCPDLHKCDGDASHNVGGDGLHKASLLLSLQDVSNSFILLLPTPTWSQKVIRQIPQHHLPNTHCKYDAPDLPSSSHTCYVCKNDITPDTHIVKKKINFFVCIYILIYFPFSFTLLFYNCIVPMGFLPRETRAAFPEESELQQRCATQPMVHAGCFSVSIIHQTLTQTTGSLTCAKMLMHAIAHRGVGTPWESALKADPGRKIPCCTGESNPCQWHAGPILYQLSYMHTPFIWH